MSGYRVEAVEGQRALAGHPAALVACADRRTWLADPSSMGGEVMASVRLFFDVPTVITSIEICLFSSCRSLLLTNTHTWSACTVNAGSALVEVWGLGSDGVARVVVLQKQAFMRPAECAAGTSTDRVRYFGADRLTPQGRATPWPGVLVVCQNPFTPGAAARPFGLAHVRFNAPPTARALPAATADDPDDAPTEEERDGGEGDEADAVGPTLPMDVDSPVHAQQAEEETLPTLLLTDDEQDGDTAARERAASMRADTVVLPDIRGGDDEVVVDDTSAISAAPAAAPAPAAEDANDFQRGVVLAISGFVNPERAQIRDAVTRHGGRYTNDVAEATHLVCAFADTPKYRAMQRRRGGAVVSKDWVFACAKAHRQLPVADFALGKLAASSSSSGSLAPASPAKRSAAAPEHEGARKRQRRKKRPGPDDSEYESSGPDEYDLTDPFVVPDESSAGSVGGRDDDDDDEEEKEEGEGEEEAVHMGAENIAETLREAQEFIREYDAREARRRRGAGSRAPEPEAIDLTQMPRAAPRRRTQRPVEDDDGGSGSDGYATDEMGEDVLGDRLRVFLGAGAAGAEARRWCAGRAAH